MSVVYDRSKDVLSQLATMFNNPDAFPDVVFLVDGEKIYSHKSILASASEHFRVMFSSRFLETNGEVLVRDISRESFKEILKFIYTGSLSLTHSNVMEILHKATEYSLGGIRSSCDDFISRNISAESVCILFEQATTYNLSVLYSECFKFICANACEVLTHKKSTHLSLQSMTKFLQSDTLSLDEVQLIKLVVNWARRKWKDEESVKENMKTLCPYFRLTVISAEELVTEIFPINIIPLEMLYEAHVYHSTQGKYGAKPGIPRIPSAISLTWEVLEGDQVTDNGSTLHCNSRKHKIIRTAFPVPINWVGYIEISRLDVVGCSDVFIGITNENSSELPSYLRNCSCNALTYATNGDYDIWYKTNVVHRTGISPKAGVGMMVDCSTKTIQFYNLESKKYVYVARFDKSLMPVYPCVSVGACCKGEIFKITKITSNPKEFPVLTS